MKQTAADQTPTDRQRPLEAASQMNWRTTSLSSGANTDIKTELRRRIASGSVDVPARGDSGIYGFKNPAPLSPAIKNIKLAKTPLELEVAATGVRSINDQNAAIRKYAVFKLAAMPAKREVVLTFNWDTIFQPEDANVARLCALEFLLRIMRNTYRQAKLPLDFNTVNFAAVPGIWSADGEVVPLHMHLVIDVPDGGLAWFDAQARQVWEQVLRSNAVMGAIHSAPIEHKDRLTRYSLKQIDLEWVFDRTIWPIDLLNYQGTSS